MLRALTPDSASPEQVRGEPITIAADVYALGMLFYRLLTGDSPYRKSATTDVQLMRAICDEVPRPPSAATRPPDAGACRPPERIDRDLDLIVLKALRKEPDRRYSSADQLSDDLGRYLEGRPVAAAPDSRAYRAGKFLRRHRVPTVARRRRAGRRARRGRRGRAIRRASPARSVRAPNGASTMSGSWPTRFCSSSTTRSRSCRGRFRRGGSS